MALTGISYAKQNHLISKKDPAYSERAMEDIEYAREMKATIFVWKALPNSVVTRIQDMQAQSQMTLGDMTTQTFNARTAARNREAFRYAVQSVENFPDEDGEPISIEVVNVLEPGGVPAMVVSEDSMNCFHGSLVSEIGNEIFNRCSMGPDERKKFEAALSLLGGSSTSNAGNATNDSAENEGAPPQQSSTETTPKAKPKRTGRTRQPAKKKTAAPVA